MKFFKIGAMFGLDARIALAIFGALSVISGAALYSAIQDANVIRRVTQMQELNKAIEQYILDTGQDLPRGTYDYIADLSELERSIVSGWKGPYFSGEYDSSFDGFKTDLLQYNDTNAYIRTDISDGESPVGGTIGVTKCSSSSNYCYYWTRYGGLKNDGLSEAIDVYIDGSLTPDTGLVRVFHNTGLDYKHVYIRGPKTLSELD